MSDQPGPSIRQQFSMPIPTTEPKEPCVILMVDTNTVTAGVATRAARELRAKWASSTILFASVSPEDEQSQQ